MRINKNYASCHALNSFLSLYRALESLVNFAYTGRIMININNVQSIMMCASFLQLNKVKDACAKFLTRRYVHNFLNAKMQNLYLISCRKWMVFKSHDQVQFTPY